VAGVSRSERFVPEESSAKITPAGGRPIAIVMMRGAAGRYAAFPGWVAVRVTIPGVDPGVRTDALSVAGPESSVRVTGNPLDAWTTTGKGGERVVMPVGGVADRVWASRGANTAMSDLLAFIVTSTVWVVAVRSPVQPAKA
jgi:hypothetical protein